MMSESSKLSPTDQQEYCDLIEKFALAAKISPQKAERILSINTSLFPYSWKETRFARVIRWVGRTCGWFRWEFYGYNAPPSTIGWYKAFKGECDE